MSVQGGDNGPLDRFASNLFGQFGHSAADGFDAATSDVIGGIDQLFRGEFTDRVTWSGTAAQAASGFFGVDVLADIRDVAYHLSQGNLSEAKTAAIFILPVIGAAKPFENFAELTSKTFSRSVPRNPVHADLLEQPGMSEIGGRFTDRVSPLGRNLGKRAGDGQTAAHIVPVNLQGRSDAVRDSVTRARAVLQRQGIDIDSWHNGFLTVDDPARHLGTHRDKYLEQLGRRLERAEEFGGRGEVLNELNNLKLEALNGDFLQ